MATPDNGATPSPDTGVPPLSGTIRVIDVRRRFIDPATASPAELDQMIEAALTLPALAKSGPSLAAFREIAYQTQGILAPFLPGVAPSSDRLSGIVAREASLNPAVRLRLVARGPPGETDTRLNFRPASRVRAIDPTTGEGLAAAAEEAVTIEGFAVDPSAAGALIRKGRPLGHGPEVAALFTTPPPEGPTAKKVAGFFITPDPEEILRHTRAAVAYYLSGAAAEVALARAAAERGGPSLLAGLRSTVDPKGWAPLDLDMWRPDPTPLRYLVGRLAATEPIVAKGWAAEVAPLADLFRVGALGIYLYALVEGRESPGVEDFLEASAIRYAKAAQLRTLAGQAREAAARARLYLTIAADLFGPVRSAELLEAVRSLAGARSRGAPGGDIARPEASARIDDPEAVAALLKPAERKLVRAEYDNRIAAWEGRISNPCPHIGLAARLRSARTAEEARETLDRLLKFCRDPAKAGRKGERGEAPAWLMCTNCGHRALCPHARDLVRLTADRASYEAIRARLSKYEARIGAKAATYCTLCCEVLAEADDGATPPQAGDADPALRSKMWVFAARAAALVRFPTPTDERAFANAATDAAYPFLAAYEARLAAGRKRTRAALRPSADDEPEPRAQVMAAIYVYAYILERIRANKRAGFGAVRPGARPSEFASALLATLAAEHRGILAQVEGISPEFIRDRFVAAAGELREEGTDAPGIAPEEVMVAQILLIDSIYRCAETVLRVAEPPQPAAAEFETILGATLPVIIKESRIDADDPLLSQIFLRRTGVEVPAGYEYEFLVKSARANLYARLYPGRPADPDDEAAFRAMGATLGGKVAKKPAPRAATLVVTRTHKKPSSHTSSPSVRTKGFRPIYLGAARRGEFFGAYQLFAEYTSKVTDPAILRAYQEKVADFRVCERGLRAAIRARAVFAHAGTGYLRSQQYAPSEVLVTALFDEGGARHVWKGAHFFRDADGKDQEVKGSVSAARSGGTLAPDMRLVDIACSVCGIRASQTGGLDPGKVNRALIAASEQGAFYIFYESRCPEGGLHEGATCAKCGYGPDIARDPIAAKGFYDKYALRFSADRATALAAPLQESVLDTPAPPEPEAPWVSDYTLIVRAAELVGVTPATIEAIGATSGRDYDDVIAGVGVPPPPAEVRAPRLYVVGAEVRRFLADYGTLRRAARLYKPLAAVGALLAAVPRGEWALAEKLPDLGPEYRAQRATLMRKGNAEDLLAFEIQSLCRFTLELSTLRVEPGWVTDAAKAFALMELKAILRTHELFSKPGPFDWALFTGTGAGDEGEDEDDQVGDVGEDVLAEALASNREEVPDSPYSGADTDYEEPDADS